MAKAKELLGREVAVIHALKTNINARALKNTVDKGDKSMYTVVRYTAKGEKVIATFRSYQAASKFVDTLKGTRLS